MTLHRLVERRLPVRFEHTAEDDIGQVIPEPSAVLVRGPQDILERVRAIPTELRALPQRGDGALGAETLAVGDVPLVKTLEGRPIRCTPAVIGVRLTLRPRQKIYELADVQVQFLCPANFALRPYFGDERAARIKLRVRGRRPRLRPR